MKKLIFASSLLLALFTACDDYEDQFNINYELKEVKNLTMTLEASDYSSIASLAANKELALSKDAEGQTYLNALTAVGKNKYFTEEAPALWYLPAYIESKYPNLDDGSKVSINYDNFENLPEYLKDFNAISTYDFTTADYKSVWGDNISASFLSPSTLYKIPSILEAGVKNPADGAMRLVNYAYSETEPSSGGGGEEIVYTSIADITVAGVGNYNAKGEVVGTYARGFLLNDGTGTILVYLNTTANYSVGDVVAVSGDVSSYNGLFQFTQSSTVTFVERNETFAYPANAKDLTADDVDAYVKKPVAEYVNLKGTLNISSNYYNIIIDGTTVQGSISYPIGGVVDATLNNKEVVVSGYAIGATSKFLNIMATSVVAADGSSVATTPIGVVALSAAGDYKVRGIVAATYGKGFLLTDGTGCILMYENKAPQVKEGDVVLASGPVSKYAGLMQMKDMQIEKIADGKYTRPAVQTLTGPDMDAYTSAPRISYVTYEGVLSITDNGKGSYYYNVTVEGTGSSKGGSISYPVDGMVDAALNGKKIIVTGYAIGTSSGWVNTMATSVSDASAAPKTAAFAVTRAATPTPNASAVYRYDATAKAWKAYTTDAAKISVIQPAIYTTMGSSYVSKPDAMLPVYLQQTYPYAKADDVVAVVYYSSSEKAISVEQYVLNADTWVKTTVATPSLIVFLKSQSVWTEAKVYYASTFLSDGGDFTIQDINLSGLQKVWVQDSKYGWKASAFVNNTNNETESWIVSPEISLKKAAAPVLKFEEAHKFLNGADPSKYLSVLVSTDYENDVTKASWKELEVKGWSDGLTWDFVSVEPIDLSDYKDKTIRIAYRYKSDADAAATWEVKNMSVQE